MGGAPRLTATPAVAHGAVLPGDVNGAGGVGGGAYAFTQDTADIPGAGET